MIRVRATEGQQRVMSLRPCRLEVVSQLPPFVAGQIRVNQIVSLEDETHSRRRYSIVGYLLDWRRQSKGNRLLPGHELDLYHLAWEVDTLDELDRIRARLAELGALAGASDHSTTKALYAKDPDGLEFEVSWLVPAHLLTDELLAGRSSIRPLDLAKERARFGVIARSGRRPPERLADHRARAPACRG
jgi:hypothetical protein